MKLNKLLKGIDCINNYNYEITNISCDSRNIKKDGLFIAIKGYNYDGNNYIEDAIKNGCITVITDDINVNCDINIIRVNDSRKALAIISKNFYHDPLKKMKIIGITGTKGKTTTSFIIKKILEDNGYKVGLIGTIGNYIGNDKIEDSIRTTPNSDKLYSLFNKMANNKCDIVIMEVSSQSLKLNRVYGIKYDIGVFTNFSRDHISKNEHKDIEDYLKSKLKLMDMSDTLIINNDDIIVSKIKKLYKKNIITYGIKNKSDINANNIIISDTYTKFDIDESYKIDIPGIFSVYNSLCAISVCKYLKCKNINLDNIKVIGRSEMINNELGIPIMIDYAHSPDSLLNILESSKKITKGRIICVFGCGGNRDSFKRPIMGDISTSIADYSIITTDNPRFEDPLSIIKDIESGIKKDNYEIIVDRTEAIKKAIDISTKNDLVLIVGKGHETYQEINGIKYPYDERLIIDEICKSKQKVK